jgi:hypothetical protein
MARRTSITLDEIADLDNLAAAFWRAARGKRHRPEVRTFADRLDAELARLRREILDLTMALGRFHTFEIRDPKVRTIHAPWFRERVLHHAMMAKIGPALERSLVDDTFACRRGKGPLAAVRRAQRHARRFPWYLKIDVESYFASIDHGVAKGQLRRRVKGRGALALCDRVIAAYHAAPGRGLPIGALTSQHLANLYLSDLDRFLLEELRLGGMVRYMDDVVAWDREKAALRSALPAIEDFLRRRLCLRLKSGWQLQQSRRGLSLCGFRVFPDALRLSRRRRRRYALARRRWETAHALGLIDDRTLQAGYASAVAITAGAEAAGWRRQELRRRPPAEV